MKELRKMAKASSIEELASEKIKSKKDGEGFIN